MKQTAVEWYAGQAMILELKKAKGNISITEMLNELSNVLEQAKEMESKQLFIASNTLAKEAYKAGQKSMYCGCYEINGCTNYEEWLYEKFKSE